MELLEMKKTWGGLNNRLDTVEEKFSKLEETMETVQNEA